MMLRIYDKRLEQLNKHKIEIKYQWVRWELELKKSRANQGVWQLLDCENLAETCIGILNNYLRFIVHDNSNRSRCSNEPTWDNFINDIKKMKLYVPPDYKDIDDTKRWLDDCVGASISAVIEADGGSLEFLYDNLLKWQIKRMKNRELTARIQRSREREGDIYRKTGEENEKT